jgi:hypothetical protein
MLLQREIELTAPALRPLAGPFPNLKTREIVRLLVTQIAETLLFVKFTADERYAFALGMVRGARIAAEQEGDTVAAPYLADLLDTLNHKGVEAVGELVQTVTGREIVDHYKPGSNFEGTPFGFGADDEPVNTARAA